MELSEQSNSTHEDTGERLPLSEEAVLFLSPGDARRAAIRADPYPFYQRLRRHAPVYRTSAGPWLITDYQLTVEFLRDNDWSRDDHAPGTPVPARTAPQQVLRSTMLFRDPPDHGRLRKLVNKAFTPGGLAQWQPRVNQITAGIVADLSERDSFDLVSEFAFRIPLTVICQMLGIPDSYSAEFAYWAEQIVESLEPSHQSEAALRKQEKAARDVEAFFTEMVRIRRAEPGPDIISALLEVERTEDLRVTTAEIVAMGVLLHIAGHETTGHLIGAAIYHLWTRPDQLALLDADRTLIPAAIEEVLRWDGPARNTTPRRAWIDKTIAGETIPAGDIVYAILGAANRDEAVFEDPDRFDVTRANNRHIAFGLGIHFCLGAHLARMECVSAVDALLSAPGRLAVQPDVQWRDSFTIRGLEALPGSWE